MSQPANMTNFMLVEIELNGVLTVKRLDRNRDEDGGVDRDAIRQHFIDLGYTVGQIFAIR
jgi:hypothetical protein